MENTIWNKYNLAVLIALYVKKASAEVSQKMLMDSFMSFLEVNSSELVKEYESQLLEKEIKDRTGEIAFFFGARPDKGNPPKQLVELIRLYKFNAAEFQALLKEALPNTGAAEDQKNTLATKKAAQADPALQGTDTKVESLQLELKRVKRFFEILSRNGIKYMDTTNFDGKILIFPSGEEDALKRLLKQRGRDTIYNNDKFYFRTRDISSEFLKEVEWAENGQEIKVVPVQPAKESVASFKVGSENQGPKVVQVKQPEKKAKNSFVQ